MNNVMGIERDMPWVIVRAGQGLFAVSTRYVQEMVSTPQVTGVPESEGFVRGLINLRGQVMPLADFRARVGLPSLTQETADLAKMLTEREADHKRWVDELRNSVREKRPFTLTTDPHACAFGRWYDTFKTDNLLLETALKRFDEPHKALHAAGREIVQAMAQGCNDSCQSRLDELTHTTLPRLSKLFAECQTLLRESAREIAVVVRGAGPTFALAVDGIESVEPLKSDAVTSIDEAMAGARSDCLESIAKRSRDAALILTVDPQRILAGEHPHP
jgi:purine-binding chemotaxis protein CheW